jgi:gliding motility-associated-like protein
MRLLFFCSLLVGITVATVNGQSFTEVSFPGLPKLKSSQVRWADFNNNGRLDVLITGMDDDGQVYTLVYRNNGDDTFSNVTSGLTSVYGASIALEDYNKDGLVDILLLGWDEDNNRHTALYRNNGGFSFSKVATDLDQLSNGSVVWADFDNDGYVDIFLSGINSSSQTITKVFRNNNGSFELQETNLPRVAYGAAISFDYNNDGKPDLMMSGISHTGSYVTRIYRNKGGFQFEDINASFDRIAFSRLSAGDLNSDGYADVIISGTNSGGTKITKVYAGSSNGVFTETATDLTVVNSSSVVLGDFNNNGRLDVLLAGSNVSNVPTSKLFVNNGDFSFADSGFSLSGMFSGSFGVGDFDNDGTLDFMQMGNTNFGSIGRLFKSEVSTKNAAPSAPANLEVNRDEGTITFSWDAATDDLTAASALTYNLYVSTESQKDNYLASLSNLANGKRKVVFQGNVGHSTTYTLNGLPEGKYYWSVQAVDHGYAGSAFAAEKEFGVCYNFTIGEDESICLNQSIALEAGTVDDVVAWSSQQQGAIGSGETELEFTVVGNDVITVEVSKPQGCKVTAQKTITALALPDFSIGTDMDVCLNSSVKLSPGEDWKLVNWYSDKKGEVLLNNEELEWEVLEDDNITVEVTDDNDCVNTQTIAINKLALPDFSIGTDKDVCLNASVDLSPGEDWKQVNWYSEKHGEVLLDNEKLEWEVLEDDKITVEVIDDNDCVNTQTIAINKLALPDFTIGTDREVCLNSSIILSPGEDWKLVNWYSEKQGEVLLGNETLEWEVLEDDKITVEVTNDDDCMSRQTIEVTKLSLPDFTIGTDREVCLNSSIFLSPGDDWKLVNWSSKNKGDVLLDNKALEWEVLEDDEITVEVTDDNECVNTQTIEVKKLALPDFTIGTDRQVCLNSSITLSPGEDWKLVNWYSENQGEVLLDNETLEWEVVEDDKITVEVKNDDDCVNTQTIEVVKLALPDFTIGTDREVCLNSSITLSPGEDWKLVNWYSENHGEVLLDNETLEWEVWEDDKITVEVTNDDDCVNTQTIEVIKLALPDFTIGTDREVCLYSSITLSPGEGWKLVNWYSENHGEVLLDNEELEWEVLEDDKITVEVTNDDDCINTQTIEVTKLALPDFSIGTDREVCLHSSITLSPGEGWKLVNWYSENHGEVLLDNEELEWEVLEDDKVTVEVTNDDDCVNTQTIEVTKLALPDFSIGTDREICFKESITLSPGEGWKLVNWYSENKGEVKLDAQELEWQVLEDDKLTVEVTNADDCVETQTIAVDVLDLPDFSLGEDTERCYDTPVFLEVGAGWAKVDWFTLKGGLILEDSWFIDHPVKEDDTILAKVMDNNGCINYDSIYVEMLPLPSFTLGEDVAICKKETIDLTPGAGWAEVNWYSLYYGLLEQDKEVYIHKVMESDIIWAEVKDGFGCVNFDTIAIELTGLPEFSLGEDMEICRKEIVELSVGQGWKAVNWFSENLGDLSKPEETIGWEVKESDRVWAEVYNHAGCVNYDTIRVAMLELPDFDLGPDLEICYKETTVLSPGLQWTQVNWYGQSQGLLSEDQHIFEYKVLKKDRIWAEVFNDFGCVNYDSLVIDVNPLPEADAGADRLMCFNEPTVLGKEGAYNDPDLSFAWFPVSFLDQPGAANPVANPDQSQTYILTVTDALGCKQYDTVWVEVNPKIILNAGKDEVICIGERVTLGGKPTATGSAFPYQYEWFPKTALNDGFVANPKATPQATTTYTLVVSTGDCKPDTAKVLVTVNPLPVVTTSPDITIGRGDVTQLNATGGEYYLWFPATWLNRDDVASPYASPSRTITYHVTAIDGNGCENRDTVTVYVRNEIFIPNLFTPNDDGQNDYFKVYGSGFKNLLFQVYDRQGKIMYQTNSVEKALEEGWDGTYQGVQQKSGTYMWSIKGEFFDGTEVKFEGKTTGVIHLVR